MARTIAFNVFFYAFTIAVAFFCLPALVLPRPLTVKVFEFWARGVRWGLKTFAGITIEFRHEERLHAALATGPIIIASKHQSMLETVMLHMMLPDPAIVLKRELTFIPLYGWFALKARMLVVNREAHAKALRQLITQARARFAQGRPIFIYPEGTRVWPGEIKGYKPGVAALYHQLGVPCLPMALNSGLVWGPREWAKRPGHVVLEYLELIPAGLTRKAFMTQLEAKIEAGTNRLLAEAGFVLGADKRIPLQNQSVNIGG